MKRLGLKTEEQNLKFIRGNFDFMLTNRFHYLFAVVAVFTASTAYSAPQKAYGLETSIAIREMRASIDEMRHEMNNHESEIRTFEEKLANQEVIIDSLREQNAHTSKINQDLTKGNLATLEMKVNSLDTASKALVSDLRQLKSHANDSSSTTSSLNHKIEAIEKVLETQNHNLENLQAAMRSLMSALEVKHEVTSTLSSDESKYKAYRIQAGDSLEKIAKIHKTSVKAIKELNDLNSDRIIVGQNIKIP